MKPVHQVKMFLSKEENFETVLLEEKLGDDYIYYNLSLWWTLLSTAKVQYLLRHAVKTNVSLIEVLQEKSGKCQRQWESSSGHHEHFPNFMTTQSMIVVNPNLNSITWWTFSLGNISSLSSCLQACSMWTNLLMKKVFSPKVQRMNLWCWFQAVKTFLRI